MLRESTDDTIFEVDDIVVVTSKKRGRTVRKVGLITIPRNELGQIGVYFLPGVKMKHLREVSEKHNVYMVSSIERD